MLGRLACCCLLWLCLTPSVWAQHGAPEPPAVSLLTFAPGQIYWQRFGHNALLLRHADGRARVYNYGIFDFEQKNFFLNFARGQMLYRLDVEPLSRTLRSYGAEGRWIFEQRLALTREQRAKLAEFLAWNAAPPNREYRYDYFLANCSTRVRDALDLVLGAQLREQLVHKPVAATYRSEVLRLMAPELALALGVDLALGPRVDVPLNAWQQSFIPMALMEQLRSARVLDEDGRERALVAQEGWLLQAESAAPAQPPALMLPFALTGLLLAAALLLLDGRRNRLARALFALAFTLLALAGGLGGLVMASGWAFTEHWGMRANQNLLLLDPLWLLLIAALPALGHNRRPGGWSVAAATLMALGGVAALLLKLWPDALRQHNLHWIALWLPLQLAIATILWRRRAAWR